MNNVCCAVGGGQPIDEVKYVSMCDVHKQEVLVRDSRRNGIPDLLYSAGDILNDPQTAIAEIQSRLKRFPSQHLIIKVSV